MKNAMVMLTVNFFCFQLEITFLGKFGPKNHHCEFKIKVWYLEKFEYAEFINGFTFLVCKQQVL